MDSPERAEHETRFALRRLFLLDVRREVKNAGRLAAGHRQGAARRGDDRRASTCRQQLAESVGRSGLARSKSSLPRTRAAVRGRFGRGRQRIGLAVQEVAGLIGPWFEAYREARTALDAAGSGAARRRSLGGRLGQAATAGKPQAVKWQYAMDDIRDQLDSAGRAARCLGTTPWNWLRHCPRYFRAIQVRLEALTGGGMAKDRQRFESSGRGGRRISTGAQQRAAAVRGRRRAGPLSLDAGGVSRIAVRAEAGHVDSRFAQAAGATVGEGGALPLMK